MDVLEAAARGALDLGIYLVNGALAVLYALAARWLTLVSLLCGLIVLLRFDVESQRLMSEAPERQGQKAPQRPRRYPQALTGAALLAWLVMGSLFPTPVPQLGTAMWVLFVLALALAPQEREALLWRSKTMLLSFCGVLLGYRILAAWTMAADPREWAQVVGTVGEAQRVVASSRGLVMSIASYAAWFAVPVGYAVYLAQRFTVHPISLEPRKELYEIAEQLRRR